MWMKGEGSKNPNFMRALSKHRPLILILHMSLISPGDMLLIGILLCPHQDWSIRNARKDESPENKGTVTMACPSTQWPTGSLPSPLFAEGIQCFLTNTYKEKVSRARLIFLLLSHGLASPCPSLYCHLHFPQSLKMGRKRQNLSQTAFNRWPVALDLIWI